MDSRGRFIKERIIHQWKSLGCENNQKSLNKGECEEFEKILQHKSKLCLYREVKCEVGLKKYLEYIKRVASILFLKFPSCTHGLFEEFDRHANGDGWQLCLFLSCKESIEHALVECVSFDSQRQFFVIT